MEFDWILFPGTERLQPISVGCTVQLGDLGNLRIFLHLSIPRFTEIITIQVDVALENPLPLSPLIYILGALLLPLLSR